MAQSERRLVMDTLTLVSALLRHESAAADLLGQMLRRQHRLVLNDASLRDLTTRLWQPPFDRVLDTGLRHHFLHDLRALSLWLSITPTPSGSEIWWQTARQAQAHFFVSDDENTLSRAHQALAGSGVSPLSSRQALLHLA